MNEFEAHEGSYDHLHTKVWWLNLLLLGFLCFSFLFFRFVSSPPHNFISLPSKLKSRGSAELFVIFFFFSFLSCCSFFLSFLKIHVLKFTIPMIETLHELRPLCAS